MPARCKVSYCTNPGKHKFPKDYELRLKWMKALRLHNERYLKSAKYIYLCADHFQDKDYNVTLPLFEGDPGTKRLKTNAVPSIFSWNSTTTLQKSETKNELKVYPVTKDYSKSKKPPLFVEEYPFLALESNDPIEDPLSVVHSPDGDNNEVAIKVELCLEEQDHDNNMSNNTIIIYHNRLKPVNMK